MEKMTDKELKKYHELTAKAKRIQREKNEFLKRADEQKEELLKRWEVPQEDELLKVANMYGCSKEELIKHITSPQQVNYFRRSHGG